MDAYTSPLHIQFVLGIILVSLGVVATAVELHLSSKLVRNQRLKSFLYRGALLLYLFFFMRMVGSIIDEYILIQYSELWATLAATALFWFATFVSARRLHRELIRREENEQFNPLEILKSKRNLIADIDQLLHEMEQSRLCLTALDTVLCPYTKPNSNT